MVQVPYTALLPEITKDYNDRASLSGYRLTFSAISAIVAGTVPSLIINAFETENEKPPTLSSNNQPSHQPSHQSSHQPDLYQQSTRSPPTPHPVRMSADENMYNRSPVYNNCWEGCYESGCPGCICYGFMTMFSVCCCDCCCDCRCECNAQREDKT